jgi:SAM-dependent methyltransferase
VADFPVDLAPTVTARLSASFDVEQKIPRALEALGPISGRDVVVIDAAGGIRARQLAELGARLTLLERDDEHVALLRAAVSNLAGVTVVQGAPLATTLVEGSADCMVGCWSAFRADLEGETAEADRVLRPDGRLLIVHDYGRDDVSRLRPADLPEYGSWSRRDGWFLRHGFKVRVLHCWWTFASMDDAMAFLDEGFGEQGRALAATIRRPRLSYNVAVYHRGRGEDVSERGAAGA